MKSCSPTFLTQNLRRIWRYAAWTAGGITLTGLLMSTGFKAIASDPVTPGGSCISPATSPFNTSNYTLNTPLQNSVPLSFYGGSMNFTASLSGGATWNSGVQVQDDLTIGNHLYLQPTNANNYLTSGKKATYVFSFPSPVVNFTMIGSGLNNEDATTIIASYQGTAVPITAANFSNLSSGMRLIDADNNGQSDTVASTSSTGGTSVIDNTYNLNIAGPIDTLTVVSGKADTRTSPVTIGLHSFGYCVGSAPSTDYGDALDLGAGTGVGNYQTTLADGGPRHTIVSGLNLGATVDGDSGNLQNAAATSDDTDQSPDDEDAFTTLPTVPTTGTYSLNNVPVTNTTGNAATLHAWIDFNKNGSFEATEYISVPVANGANSANLSWTIPSGTTSGNTYARFRLTTQTLTDFTGSATVDERSIGPALNGEVEDYAVAIAAAPDRSDAPISYGDATHTIISGLRLGATIDGDAASLASANADGDDTNNTDDEDGISAFPTLTAGAISYSVPTANISATGTGTLHAWIDFNKNGTFESGEQTSVAVTNGTLASALTWNGITVGATGNTVARFRFTSDASVTASTPSGAASNGEVEDYAVAIATATFDFGDAPTSLTTIDATLTNTYPSASHALDGATFLGDRVDADSANQPNDNADGDDTNGSPNDEDGVAFPLAGTTRVLSSGQSNTVTVKASQVGFLNAWIDWNQDGDWNDTGEQIATNVNLTAGNNTLTLTTPNTAPHGATYARFRFSTTSGLGPTGASTANGEVEDYKVNLVLPAPVACNSGVLNDGFEQPVIPGSGTGTPPVLQDFGNGRIVSYREADVPWWGTISNSPSSSSSFDERNAIELWNGTQTAVPDARPFEGNQFAEINANVDGRLYQDLAVPPGTIIRWQVAHRGRQGDDTLGVFIGIPDSEISQGSYTTPNTEWRVYSGTYTVPNDQFITRFALRAVNTAGGIAAGNFVDDIRLSNFCAPTVRGYKSAKLTTDADNNSKISPGDTLTYTLYYANSSGAATGPAAGFQINDLLPSGLSITATGAQTITVRGGNTSANKNPNYTGAATGDVSNLLNPGALLDVGGVIRVDIPVTVGATANGTLLNQGTSSANEFSGQNVRTDNTDNTNTGLPTGVTIPASSVVQTQTSTVDPTQVIVINPAFSNSNLILVKRITEINGDRIQNPNATTNKLNQVLDRPSFAGDDAFPTNIWPNNFLKGAYDAGPIKPGDTLEYTIYFMNSSGADAANVKICDRIVGVQQFVPDAYGTGRDIEYQLGTNGVQYLTKESLASVDRAELNASTGTIAGCPNPTITGTNNGTVVIDITGSGSTGQQTLTTLPGGTAQGTPTNSYGYFRFKTKINP